MGICKDLSEFDRGQTVKARCPDQSISKISIIYEKCSKEGTLLNQQQVSEYTVHHTLMCMGLHICRSVRVSNKK